MTAEISKASSSENTSPKPFRFLVFSDLHYEPGVLCSDSPARLQTILARAERENVSFVIQLGDFCHNREKNGWLIDQYLSSPIPVYSGFGNHDTDRMTVEENLALFHMENNYYFFDRGGYRFLMLDPNYDFDGKECRHYAPGLQRHSNRGYLPPEQLAWLDKTLRESPYPCILFSHESAERTNGILNRDDAWNIISAVHIETAVRVLLWINGHYHCDNFTVINDVCCLDLNSVSYYWSGVENHCYTEEEYQKTSLLKYCLFYDTALSAVITLNGSESLSVSGTEGNFLGNPSEDEILRLDQLRISDSRRTVPYISNYQHQF